MPWLGRQRRMTKRLAKKIAGVARALAIKDGRCVVRRVVDTVKEVDRRAFGARLGALTDPLDIIWRIAADEFPLDRSHAYATAVLT